MAKVTKKKTAAKKTSTAKKKTTAKKKAATKKTVKRAVPKTFLTAKELKRHRELLIQKLNELLGDYNQMETDALRRTRHESSGDLSSMPIHMADLGSDNFEQEFALGLLDSERKLLKEIHDALERIDNKTYGICEGTGKHISEARLEAKPWARYCIEYARMVEQGLVIEGEKVYEESEEEEIEEEKTFGAEEFLPTEDDDDIDLNMMDQL